MEKAFFLAKHHDTLSRRAQPTSSCATLEQHFRGHFNHTNDAPTPEALLEPASFAPLAELPHVPYDVSQISADPPEVAELRSIIAKLRNKKACTDAPAESVKAALDCPFFCEFLVSAFHTVWTDVSIPTEWRINKLIV